MHDLIFSDQSSATWQSAVRTRHSHREGWSLATRISPLLQLNRVYLISDLRSVPFSSLSPRSPLTSDSLELAGRLNHLLHWLHVNHLKMIHG